MKIGLDFCRGSEYVFFYELEFALRSPGPFPSPSEAPRPSPGDVWRALSCNQKGNTVPNFVKISEAARMLGLSAATLTTYETKGLLLPAWRTPSGHRLYDPRDIEKFIRPTMGRPRKNTAAAE